MTDWFLAYTYAIASAGIQQCLHRHAVHGIALTRNVHKTMNVSKVSVNP